LITGGTDEEKSYYSNLKRNNESTKTGIDRKQKITVALLVGGDQDIKDEK
jgi:hypothetical protein